MDIQGKHRGPEGQMQMQHGETDAYYQNHCEKAMEMMDRTVRIETSGCQLPELDEFFSTGEWELLDLVTSRDKLNEIKNSLDDWDRRRWERAAADANPADQVRTLLRSRFHVELGTVAWAKMYETIWQCDMMPLDSPAVPYRERGSPGVVSVHLCEAPGAFIAATNHFVKTHRRGWNWDWMAVSLNPYCEANDKFAMIEDDALIAATTPKWCFGDDNTGDIRRIPNIRNIWQRAQQLCQQMGCPDGVLMVTADGAVDTSMDPNRQELITASLHYCEVVAALGLLAIGGNFIWKGFTLYEHPSICSLYLMGCLFDQVRVYKPATSKPANSEVYVIGKGFRGVPPDVLDLLLQNCGEDVFTGRSLFPLGLLPEDFLDTARSAAAYFGNTTAEAIRDAINLEGLSAPAKRSSFRRAKDAFAEHWCSQLQVKHLDRALYLAPNTELEGRRNNTSGKRKGNELTGNLSERQDQYKKRREALGLGSTGGPEESDVGNGWNGGGGLGLGAREGGGDGGGGRNEMQMSSKAMAMMAKMGHVEGQGLGRSNQGMASMLEVAGNRRRAGLGLGQDAAGSGSAIAAADWSLAPDSAVLMCQGPFTPEETMAWPPLSSCVAPPPPQIIKSKMVHKDEALLALRVARREFCSVSAEGDGTGVCRHVQHCVAPRRLTHASRAYWKLAAVDSALEVCRIASNAALRNEALPRALDLSLLSGAGATEYLISTADAADGQSDWRVVALDTDSARHFAVASPAGDLTAGIDPRVRLRSLPLHSSASPNPFELCTADSAVELAAEVPSCWLVVGDMGSLRRVQGTRTGTLEGELSPAYRRALLWEVATALGCLAPGGCAVLRLGGSLTIFSASVLYILYRCFEKVTVVKPFACCACSSERLVVALGCLHDVGLARQRVLEALQVVAGVEVPSSEAELPAALVTEVVPAGMIMRETAFLRYMERRTTALAERETRHCRAAIELAAGGEPLPTEEERMTLANQAESVLRGEPPSSFEGSSEPPGDHGGDDDIQRKYGGMFTRGGLGSDPDAAGGVGSGSASLESRPGNQGAFKRGEREHGDRTTEDIWAAKQRVPPCWPVAPRSSAVGRSGLQRRHGGGQHQQPGHLGDLVQNGGVNGGAGGGFRGEGKGSGDLQTVVFRLLSRSVKGDEFVCWVQCELTADVASRSTLDCADGAVAVRYCYRDDYEPQHHFECMQPLLPQSEADAARLSRFVVFLSNAGRASGREKVALLTPLTPAHADGDEQETPSSQRLCVSLPTREGLEPPQDSLLLWC